MKATNSGIPQGTFMKKTTVRNKAGAVVSPMDFSLGEDICLSGNTFHLCSCDDFTRNFCAANGNELAPNKEMPLSNFESAADFAKKYKPIKDRDMKKYEHSKMGGPMIKDERKFLTNDRKVLKFYVQALDGELMVFH